MLWRHGDNKHFEKATGYVDGQRIFDDNLYSRDAFSPNNRWANRLPAPQWIDPKNFDFADHIPDDLG